MRQKIKEEIKKILEEITVQITWDRYTEFHNVQEHEIKLFGWIKRSSKKKIKATRNRDFILIRFYRPNENYSFGIDFTTSSAKYSNQISRDLGIKWNNYSSCKKWEENPIWTFKWILCDEKYPSRKGADIIYFSACKGQRIVEDENAKETRIYFDNNEEERERKKQIDDLKKKFNNLDTKEDTAQYQIAFMKLMDLKHFYFGRLKEKEIEKEEGNEQKKY